MSGIVPNLSGYPDRAVAEAMSECQLRPDAFKVIFGVDPEDPNPEFPPKPAYVSAISIAYLEDLGGNAVRRQFTMFPHGSIDMEEVAQAHSDKYGQIVGYAQQQVNGDSARLFIDFLKPLVLEKMRQDKLRTYGAFVTFTTAKGDEHFNGYLAPRRAALELPLFIRDGLVRGRAVAEEILGTDPLPDMPEEIRGSIEDYLRNDSKLQALASRIISTEMPEPEIIRDSSEIWLAGYKQSESGGPRPPSRIDYENNKHEGLSRTERRKLQAKERREERKKRNSDQ